MNSRVEFRIFTIVDLDKEEEYLHEMHLKGWKYRTSRFGLFYFDQCQPDDVIYCIYDSRFLKNISMNCKILEIEVGNWWSRFCSILRKSSSDLLPEDQVYMSNNLRWEVMRYRLLFMCSYFLRRFCCLYEFVSRRTVAIFLCHFALYAFMISLSNPWFFRLKRKYQVDGR